MAKELKDHNYYGIDSTIIADSVNEFGDRLTTFVVTIPRIILAEFNTHRMFSRNSASSRAIPAKEMIRRVKEQPFIPIAWQKEHSGMQGTKYFDFSNNDNTKNEIVGDWLSTRDLCLTRAEHLTKLGVTKQITNRLLEPFLWHTVIITATEYENFFKLRCPNYEFTWDHAETKNYRSRKDLIKDGAPYLKDKDDLYWLQINKGMGEIHIMALAESMWDNYNENQPKLLKENEWHIPFGDTFDYQKLLSAAVNCGIAVGSEHLDEDIDECMRLTIEDAMEKVAVARCARISYGTFEGKEDYEADIKLYHRLLSSGHLSPFEHVAKCINKEEYFSYSNWTGYEKNNTTIKEEKGWCRNFKGFIQLRTLLD